MLLQINQIYQRHLDSPFTPIVFKFPWGLTTTSFYNDRWGKFFWTFNTNLLPDCVACIKVFLVDFILKFEPSFCNSTSMRKRKLSKQKGFFPQEYIGSTFITNFLKAYFGVLQDAFWSFRSEIWLGRKPVLLRWTILFKSPLFSSLTCHQILYPTSFQMKEQKNGMNSK